MAHSVKIHDLITHISNETGASYAAVCFVIKGLVQSGWALGFVNSNPRIMAQFTRDIVTPKELFAMIDEKGASVSGIAAELKKSHTLVRQVVNSLSSSVEVETYLSKNLGIPRRNLFPGLNATKRRPGRQQSKGFIQ